MPRVLLTPRAQSELRDILDYIVNDSSTSIASRVYQRFLDTFELLSESPGIGHYREELLDRRFRFARVHQFLIVYEWEAQPIRVVTIVHGARDLDEFFNEFPELL